MDAEGPADTYMQSELEGAADSGAGAYLWCSRCRSDDTAVSACGGKNAGAAAGAGVMVRVESACGATDAGAAAGTYDAGRVRVA